MRSVPDPKTTVTLSNKQDDVNSGN